jgi:hypothetical protein
MREAFGRARFGCPVHLMCASRPYTSTSKLWSSDESTWQTSSKTCNESTLSELRAVVSMVVHAICLNCVHSPLLSTRKELSSYIPMILSR